MKKKQRRNCLKTRQPIALAKPQPSPEDLLRRKRCGRLPGKVRFAIMEYIAMGYGIQNIIDSLIEDFGVKVNRSLILENYIKNPKRQKFIQRLRERRFKTVTNQALFYPGTRLRYLNVAINKALQKTTDKLYFTKEGKLVGKQSKIYHGAVAGLIKEAREEAVLANNQGKQDAGALRVSLTQIIKDVAKDGSFNIRTEARVDTAVPSGADQVDPSDSGDIQIF